MSKDNSIYVYTVYMKGCLSRDAHEIVHIVLLFILKLDVVLLVLFCLVLFFLVFGLQLYNVLYVPLLEPFRKHFIFYKIFMCLYK